MSASGLPQNFEVRAAGVPNAAAVIRGTKRYILYNQYFVEQLKSATKNNWAPVSVMAHEIGHHLSGHTLDNLGSRPNLELEADYFSGFILQRIGGSLDDARAAMTRIGTVTGSSTHPPKHDRLAAITSGWNAACGECRSEPIEIDPIPQPSPSENDIDVLGDWDYISDIS